jgi:hypothetical protein
MMMTTALMTDTSAPAAHDPWAMTADSKTGDGTFEVCPKGNLPGRIVGVIDLGHQRYMFSGEEKESRQIVLIIEMNKKQTNGKPFVMGERYTWSFNAKSNFREIVESVTGESFPDGKSFRPPVLLGLPVFVNVIHKAGKDKKGNDTTYANIQGISQFPDEMPQPPSPTNPLTMWTPLSGETFPDDTWMPRVYGKVIKDLARESREMRQPGGAAGGHASPASTQTDEDIPF